MQKKHYFSVLALAGALTTGVLTGCVDENYDLENIDTTMQFQVNNLTLPLNLAPVKLDDVVDLTSEECIDTINGEYVLLKEGEFTSAAMSIARIEATPHAKNDAKTELRVPQIVGGLAVEFPAYSHQFNYRYDDVEDYIVKIESGKVDVTLTLTIIAKNDNGAAIPGKFTNLNVILPKGFYGDLNGKPVDEQSGNVIKVDQANTDNNGALNLDFHVDNFDFAASGATLASNVFALDTEMGIQSGTFTANASQQGSGKITTEFKISKLNVETVTGTIYYDIKELKVNEDIKLNNLPDVLTDNRTDISLRNPQLYLTVTNPLGDIHLQASTGLMLQQVRAEGQQQSARLAERLEIKGIEEPQSFCLLPNPDGLKALYHKFAGATKYEFTNFNNILAGQGLPEALKVDFETPMIDKQRVENFPLGVGLGEIKGNYTLFAPLELGDNSTIYYEGDTKDWGLSSDSDELDISLLVVEADVTSNLPIGVNLTAKPLDTNGDVITGVKVSSVEIPAGQTKHIEIKAESINGAFRNLDGLRYTAIINSSADAKALSPQSSLTLNNLKVRVTGNYIVKDDDKD